MEPFLVSTGVVALAEIGDKTQLLAVLLAARFRKPVPIIAGILVATLTNHGLAGALGAWITATANPAALRWILGLSFIAMAIWTLIPESGAAEDHRMAGNLGVFGTTAIAFFLAEMGDKSQVATVALAAHYAAPLWVVLGALAGELIVNGPSVLLSHKLADRLPVRLAHAIAAAIFALLGAATLLGAGEDLGF